MIRLTRAQIQPIGVDLGLDSIKMLQLEVVGQSLVVVAAAKQSLPEEVRGDPERHLVASLEALRQLLRQGDFHGRHIVAALPRGIVQVKNLRLPMMPAGEVEPAVEFEARNIFPIEPEQATVRYLPAGEVRQGTDTRLEVIALAARTGEIASFVERLHRTGCIVDSLDFEPSALYRGVERFIRRREDEAEVHVLVDIGFRRSQVVIGRGKEISFYKPLEIGAGRLQDAVARKLGITEEEARGLRRKLLEAGEATGADPVHRAVLDATRSTVEELAREVGLCLRYYSVTFRGHKPSKVRLLGGESSDRQIRSTLAAVLPLPVEPGRPLASVDTSRMRQSDRQGFMGEWAVAFGLGLKQVREYFGARDGKKRDPNAPVQRGSGQGVEVIDLAAAVAGAEGGASRGEEIGGAAAGAEGSRAGMAQPKGDRPTAPREVAHA